MPFIDPSGMDIRRFGAHMASREYAKVRALDAYSRYYDIVYPHEERPAGRPLRIPPAYEPLRALDASFGEKAGWERVNWFDSNAAAGSEDDRPDGLAGAQLVAGDRRRVLRAPATRPASSTSPRSRSSTSPARARSRR